MKTISMLRSEKNDLTFPYQWKNERKRVHLLALGDVGATLLLGLKLLGKDAIDTIGIYDVNPKMMDRFEIEMNQIGWPMDVENLPKVVKLEEDELFDCDMFIFCASKAIPPIGHKGDVRMAQFDANRDIVSHFADMAGKRKYKGIFAVVSDPVDPLCKVALISSGLKPAQVKGFGLGVMNKRAEFFARRDERFISYLKEGRAFGPHGEGLVIANSIENYDNDISMELTKLTTTANLMVRELGFKPFYAPAISSGAISLILTLMGEWNYSSVYLGDEERGAFLGVRNRYEPCENGRVKLVYEDLNLPDMLFDRIKKAYDDLCDIV